MLENLRCPQGHQWDAADAPRNCPVCGQAAVAPPGETVSYEAEPPPDLTQGAEPNAPEDHTLPASAETPVGPPTSSPRVPGFEILRELGRGGMAVVYLARQTKLNRLVALKMILSGSHAGVADLERFRAEAEAIAQLRHPHIVEIYSVGEHGGRPFFVLEYVDGGTLAQKLDGQLAPAAAAHLLEMLARGIHAAHQRGIIHRDLKPANILLSTKNEEPSTKEEKHPSLSSFVLGTSYLPKIADFGLAKQLDADHGKTRTGAILGTPSYMSPEQAGGKKDLGPAADVYSLGAILYECLAGKPPFKADSPLDTVLEVIAGQVAPPRRVQPKIPRDLETICLKCLHKEPPRRYASAQALAEDLRRFQEGAPILARPTSAWERSWRWLWRRPAALAAIVLLLAAVSLAGILYSNTLYRLVANRGQVVVESVDPGVRLLIRREGRQVASLEPGREKTLLLDAGDYDIELADAPEGLELSAEHFTVTRNGREVIQVRKEVVGELRRFEGHRGPVYALALSPDGRIALSGSGQPGSDRTLRLWDVATGHELRRLGRQDTDVETVAFAPDGRSALSAGSDGIVRLWDVQTGEMIRTFEGHKRAVHSVVFSPDGRQVLSCGADKTLRLWDAATGNAIRTLEGHTDAVWSAAFHPEGDRIVSAGADRTLRLWDRASGKERLDFQKSHAGWVVCVAFRPDGDAIASGGVDGLVRLWDARTGKITQRLRGHTKAVTRVAFTPNGRHIVSTSADRTIRLWDAVSGRELRKLTGHTDGVLALALAPDGRHFLSAGGANLDDQWIKGRDFSLRWWALPRVLPKPLSQPSERTGELLVLRGHTAEVQPVAFSPGGEYILSGGGDSTVRLWDAETGEEIRRFSGATGGAVLSLAFSPDGKQALTGSNDSSLRLWDVATGKEIRRWLGHFGQVKSIAFSPDGKSVLTTENGQYTILRWNAATGQIRLRFTGHQQSVESVAFSPDGKRALTAGFDRTLRLWDAETGKELRRFTGHTQRVRNAVFSSDGKRVLSGSDDSTIRLWDVESGEELLCLMGHQGFVNAVAISPDGGRAVSVGQDGTVRLWDLVSGHEVSSFKGHEGEVVSVSFAPDGSRVATGGRDRTVRVWQLPPSSDRTGPLGRLVLDTDTPTVPLLIKRAGRVMRQLNPPSTRPVPLPAGKGYTVAPAANQRGLRISPAEFSLADGATQRIEVRRQPDYAGEIMRLDGLSIGVMGLAVAPRGDRLLSATYDNQLQLWDLRGGKPLWTLANAGGHLLGFSPDGRRIAIANRAFGLWVRDAEKGAKVSQLGMNTTNITAIAFLPDGDRILSAEQDGRLRLWDVAAGKELRCLDSDYSSPAALAVSRDGKRILAGSRDGTLALWDVEKGEVIRLFAGRHAELGSVALSPDGKLALSVSNRGGAVFLWDAETGKQLRRLVGHKWMTLGAAFLPDGRRALSWGTGQPNFILWEVPSGRPLHSSWLPPISANVMAVAAAPASVPGSAALAVWGETSAVFHVWQVPYPPAAEVAVPPEGEAELVVDLEGLPGSVRVLQKGQVVRTVQPAQTGQTTAVPLAPGEYEVELDGGAPGTDLSPARFTLRKGEQQVVAIQRGPQFVGEVRRLATDLGLGRPALLPDGRHFLAARADGTLSLGDWESGRVVRRFDKGHMGLVWGLCVTPDGKRAVSAGQDGTLRVWDIATGKERARCNHLSSQYRGELALSADGKQVLCANSDRFLLLDTSDASVTRRFPATVARAVLSVALSPDGRRALTGHSDGTVKVWDIAAGKEEGVLPGRTAAVEHTTFAPDGRLALSADQGGTVRLWDMQGRKELGRIRLGRTRVAGTTFTPDSRRFLVASWDGNIRMWDAETREEVYRFFNYSGASALIFLNKDRRLLLSNSQFLIVRQLPGKDHAEGQLAFDTDGTSVMVTIKGEGKVVQRTVYTGGVSVVDLKPGEYELELPRNSSSTVQLSARNVRIQTGRVQVIRVQRVLAPLVAADPQRVADGQRELKALLAREPATAAERARRRADLFDLARRYRGLAPALSAAETLRRLPSPLDGLQRDRIPAALLALLGGGKAEEAPSELVAVLDFRNEDGIRAPVSAFAFRGDGAALAAGSSGGLLKLWSLTDGKELRSWTAHPGAVRAVAFSPDDRLLATAGEDRLVVLWDPATGKKVRELRGHGGPVGALAFSPDGQTLATGGSGEFPLRLWRVADGESRKRLGEEKDAVTDLEFSPDGSLLLSGSGNNRIRVWNVAAGTVKRTWVTGRRQAHGVAFSPDGAFVGTASGNALTLWGNGTPGAASRFLYGTRPSALRCLAFRPDGREVAGGFSDGTIALWDLETGLDDSIQLPSADSFFQLAAISQVRYSPDGRYLAVSHNRGLVSILRRTPDENKKP